MGMRLPPAEHTARPWRIHELTPDFRLGDVWATPGIIGPDDFPRIVDLVAAHDPSHGSSCIVRTLFAARWWLGDLFGWDKPDNGVGARVPTLRDRLPADLRNTPRPEFGSLPFTSLYLLEDEFAAEAANQTMHGVLHLGLVPDGPSGYRVQMAVLVKPNGLLGDAYMAAIKPFRYLFVYPLLLREISRTWDERVEGVSPAPSPRRPPTRPRGGASPSGSR